MIINELKALLNSKPCTQTQADWFAKKALQDRSSVKAVHGKNNGFNAEHYVAIECELVRDGRSAHTDIWTKYRQRVEVKFFSEGINRQMKVVQGTAHGFVATKGDELLVQLQHYCCKFDILVVGFGECPEKARWYAFNRREAYEFLKIRLSNKAGSEEVRFCHGGDTPETGHLKRDNTLRERGYNI